MAKKTKESVYKWTFYFVHHEYTSRDGKMWNLARDSVIKAKCDADDPRIAWAWLNNQYGGITGGNGDGQDEDFIDGYWEFVDYRSYVNGVIDEEPISEAEMKKRFEEPDFEEECDAEYIKQELGI